jgi:hypothetical protein
MKKIFVSFISAALIVFGMSVFSPVAAASCPFGGSPNWKGECDTTTENGEEYFGPPMTEEEAKIYTENNSKPKTSEPSNANDSVATKCPFGGSPNWQGVCDTTTEDGKEYHGPPMTETQVQEHNQNNNYFPVTPNTSSNVANEGVSSNNSNDNVPEIVIANPDSAHGYAVVDASGNVLNAIVCAYNVCGKDNNWLNLAISQGAIPSGAKLILQTLRDQETGNVAGYMNAKYDFNNKIFIINGSICAGDFNNRVCNTEAIFKIPVAYPGSQELTCIQNCDVPTVEEEQNNTSGPVVTQENNIEENLTPMIFSTKLKPNTLANIIAINKNKTKIWKVKVNKKGIIKINIGKKYKGWKFSVKVRA